MADFAQIEGIRINLDNVVDVLEFQPVEEGWDEEFGERIRPQPYSVEILTNATTSTYDDGGDYPERAHLQIEPVTISLRGEQAEAFMARLDGGEREANYFG